MKIKTVLATLFLVAIALAIALGVSNVSAQGPGNTGPASALYMDNQTHPIPPNTTLWYKFDYNADRLPVEITLFSGAPMQLQFNVYPPDQIGTDWSVGKPIGRGMPPTNSDNLVWKSVFYGAGTFYVELINSTSTARTALLSISGGGYTPRVQSPLAAPTPLPPPILPPPPPPQPSPSPTINFLQVVMIPAIATLRAPFASTTNVTTTAPVTTTVTLPEPVMPTTTPTPQNITIVLVPATAVPSPTVLAVPTVPAPTATATPPPVVNDWFTNAFYVVNGRTYTIPGNSERWFVFGYDATDRSIVEIRIPGGNEKKLQFRVFTTDQILRYTVDGTPTGVGTAPIVTCDSGRCTSNDLVWAGAFMMNGTYFIQVTNFDPTPKNYEITVTGGGVTLGR